FIQPKISSILLRLRCPNIMNLYITGIALALIGVLYGPVAFLVLRFFWKKLSAQQRARRIGVIIVASLVATGIPLWDVLITSAQMAMLCAGAGITVKRTVKVDGFYTNLGGADLVKKKGFRFVEVRKGTSIIELYTMEQDGAWVQRFDTNRMSYILKSRYEF